MTATVTHTWCCLHNNLSLTTNVAAVSPICKSESLSLSMSCTKLVGFCQQCFFFFLLLSEHYQYAVCKSCCNRTQGAWQHMGASLALCWDCARFVWHCVPCVCCCCVVHAFDILLSAHAFLLDSGEQQFFGLPRLLGSASTPDFNSLRAHCSRGR